MVKVFFADAGSTEQLLESLGRIEQQAVERVGEIAAMAATRPLAFPERAHLSALTMQLVREQEEATRRWAHWAGEQVRQWLDTTDPANWDTTGVLSEISRMSPHGGSLGS